jgi:hypothetical protein
MIRLDTDSKKLTVPDIVTLAGKTATIYNPDYKILIHAAVMRRTQEKYWFRVYVLAKHAKCYSHVQLEYLSDKLTQEKVSVACESDNKIYWLKNGAWNVDVYSILSAEVAAYNDLLDKERQNRLDKMRNDSQILANY